MKRIVGSELQSAEKSDLSMFMLQYKCSGFSDCSMLYSRAIIVKRVLGEL